MDCVHIYVDLPVEGCTRRHWLSRECFAHACSLSAVGQTCGLTSVISTCETNYFLLLQHNLTRSNRPHVASPYPSAFRRKGFWDLPLSVSRLRLAKISLPPWHAIHSDRAGQVGFPCHLWSVLSVTLLRPSLRLGRKANACETRGLQTKEWYDTWRNLGLTCGSPCSSMGGEERSGTLCIIRCNMVYRRRRSSS